MDVSKPLTLDNENLIEFNNSTRSPTHSFGNAVLGKSTARYRAWEGT